MFGSIPAAEGIQGNNQKSVWLCNTAVFWLHQRAYFTITQTCCSKHWDMILKLNRPATVKVSHPHLMESFMPHFLCFFYFNFKYTFLTPKWRYVLTHQTTILHVLCYWCHHRNNMLHFPELEHVGPKQSLISFFQQKKRLLRTKQKCRILGQNSTFTKKTSK